MRARGGPGAPVRSNSLRLVCRRSSNVLAPAISLSISRRFEASMSMNSRICGHADTGEAGRRSGWEAEPAGRGSEGAVGRSAGGPGVGRGARREPRDAPCPARRSSMGSSGRSLRSRGCSRSPPCCSEQRSREASLLSITSRAHREALRQATEGCTSHRHPTVSRCRRPAADQGERAADRVLSPRRRELTTEHAYELRGARQLQRLSGSAGKQSKRTSCAVR